LIAALAVGLTAPGLAEALPRVASVERQADFIAMYERVLTGLGTDGAVYFADAVHPEYQTRPAYGWVKAGSCPARNSR